VRHRIPLTLFHSTPAALAANRIEQHTQMNRTQQGGKWSASTRARSRDVHLTEKFLGLDPGISFVPLSLVVRLALRSALPRVLSSGSSSLISRISFRAFTRLVTTPRMHFTDRRWLTVVGCSFADWLHGYRPRLKKQSKQSRWVEQRRPFEVTLPAACSQNEHA